MKVQTASSPTMENVQAQAARSSAPESSRSEMPEVFDTSMLELPDGDERVSGARLAESSSSTNHPQFGVPTSYASTPSGPLHADPAAHGVYRDGKGHAFIRQGDQTHPVRYDKDNSTWRVHSPANPTKYQYPVKRDENGTWQMHGEVGLPGGWKGAPPHGAGWAQHAVIQLQQQVQQLEHQRQQLQQQRHDLQSQLQQFPGPQHASRSPLERAILQNMLQTQLTNLGNQLHAVEQQVQQANQQLQQLQNELPH